VKRLREARPEPGFTISMRVQWNGLDFGALRAECESFAAIGVEHLMIAPRDRDVDDWDKVIDGVGTLLR
jgi:hypothetical protein